MEDYNPISQTVSATTRACIKVSTIDNSETEPNKNFTLDLFFMSVFTSRDFATDTPSITVEIIDNDGKEVSFLTDNFLGFLIILACMIFAL